MLNAGSIIATMGMDRSGFRRGVADTRRDVSGLRGYMKAQFRGMADEVSQIMNSRLTQALSIGAVWYGLNKAWEASDKLEASQRTLAATAKITGQNLGFLQVTARDANEEFTLGRRLSNDFTIELTKLTGKAGEIEQTGLALGRALDLGAARGLDAEQTLQAVRQSILGIDEGTDKLFGANPSVLYERYATAIGTTAGKLTDMQKAQAILTALMEEGGKVAGQYAEFLASPAGEAVRLRIEQEEAAAAIGRSVNAIRQVAFPVFRQLLDYTVKFIGGIQLLGAEFPVYIASFRLWLAELNEEWGGGLERIANKIQGFYEWGRTLPEWAQWIFGFKMGEATIGGVADFIAGTAETGVETLRAELERTKEAYKAEAARIVAEIEGSMAITGDTNPLDALIPATAAGAAAEALKKARDEAKATADAVRDLREAGKLGILTPEDWNRALELNDRLNEKLRAGNLTLGERVTLTEQIRALGLTPRGGMAEAAPSAPGIIQRADVPGSEPGFFERIAEGFGLAREEAGAFSDVVTQGVGSAFYGLGNVVEDVFSAFTDSSKSAAEAFRGGMLSALAGVARGFGQFFIARAAGAVAESILNPFTAPKNLLAAAKLGAAAAGMFAIAGLVGGAGGGGGAGGVTGGGFARAGSSERIAEAVPKTELHVWMDPISAANPRHQGVIFETAAAGGGRRGVDLYVNGQKAAS